MKITRRSGAVRHPMDDRELVRKAVRIDGTKETEKGTDRMYADIIIDITHEKLDKVFQYRVPEELEGDLRTGAGVIVPFGRGNRETKGYIVGFSETCDYDAEKIKDILRTDTSSVSD